MKAFWFRVFYLALAGMLVASVFYTFLRERVSLGEPQKFIPASSEIAVRIDRYINDGRLRSALIPEWNVGSVQHAINRWISHADSLYSNSSEWNEVLSGGPVWLVFPSAAKPSECVAIAPLARGAEVDPKALMRAWTSSVFSDRSFQSYTIYKSADYSMAHEDACLLWSVSGSALEGALMAISSEEWCSKVSQLSRVASTDAPIHCFLKVGEDRIVVDVPYLPTQTWMGGYWFPGANGYMKLSTEGSFGFHDVLPASCTFVESWSFPDFDSGWRSATMDQPDNAESYWMSAWRDLGDSCQCDLNEAVLSWRGGEWGTALLDETSSSIVAFFSIRDSLDAIHLMRPILGDSTRSAAGIIYEVRYPEVFRRNSTGSLLTEARFLLQRGGYVMASADPAVLVNIIGPVLRTNPVYRDFLLDVKPEGGKWVYRTSSITGAIPASIEALVGVESPMAMHLIQAGDDKLRLTLSHSAMTSLGKDHSRGVHLSGSLWQLKLPARATGRYWVTRNHLIGHQELLIEDVNNSLHLVNAEGQLLWSYALREPVLGEVSQVDAMKNGKLQLVFNTSRQIYLVDRNGHDVRGFPVKLNNTASCGLIVADYDNNRTYRLLIGCQNGELLNYGLDGSPTKGWGIFRANGPIMATGHFRLGNEDFLMCWSSSTLQLLKRTGELKYSPKGNYSGYNGGHFALRRGLDIGSCSVAFLRDNTTLLSVRLGEGKETIMAADLAAPSLRCVDVNGDQKADLLLADQSDFRVYDSSTERMFGLTLPGFIRGSAAWFPGNGGDGRLGIPLMNGEYYLMSFRGDAEEGFPLAGTDAVVMGDFSGDGRRMVIAIRGNEVQLLSR